MKYIILLLLLAVVPLLAHPPKNIELNYDSDTGVLSVEVMHNVSDASKHFIYKVKVELNGKMIIEQTFKSQVDNEKQQVLYKVIDAKDGDKFTVEAYCNISGKKKAQLEVTMSKSSEGL